VGWRGQRLYQLVAGVVAVVALGVGLLLFLRVPPESGQAQEGLPLFPGWGKPEVALLLSGQQHGYYQPCGCSPVMYGGLTRRYNFLQTLRSRGWAVVAVDLGDIADVPTKSSPQTLLKYVYSMKALRLMDYTAVGFGVNELRLPLDDALNIYALNHPSPRVIAANLLDREKKGDRFHETVASWELGGQGTVPCVGVFGLIGPTVERDGKDPTVKFARETPKVLEKTLRELRTRGAELTVLLYQGTLKEAAACAGYCARRRQGDPSFPRLDVVLCLSEEDEPPGSADQASESLLIRVGHKGRYVGVLGAFRTGKAAQPWQLRYQMVKIGPEYDTPADKVKGHPVMDLFEEFALDIKQGNYLAKFPRSKHPVQLTFGQAKFVGSERCSGCHEKEYEKWEKSGHAKAYATLEKASKPRNRQYDGECIVCHVVGFSYETGFADEKRTPKLKNVGCESCHGPCSEHVKDTGDAKIRAMINPYRWRAGESPQARIHRRNQIDIFCQKCHDIDNDHHFSFAEKWAKIVHPMPKRNRPPEAPAMK
jgi:hypothetical protein